jgi:hypothetical protein
MNTFNTQTGKADHFAPNQLVPARFHWNIHFFFSLPEAVEYYHACGGKITDEAGNTLYPEIRPYNHDDFRKFVQEKASLVDLVRYLKTPGVSLKEFFTGGAEFSLTV